MQEQIGQTAGKVWLALGKKGETNLAMLPKVIKEKSEITFQALGWLAHEGKIIYQKKGDKNFVALSPREQEVFKTVH
ncbi:MAG: winged helix-turn-helix domain-containing protein [Candidatus Margulisbacteria bacterium]|nr:winged helix-turn-helix domain-containing protein [Candidatus Margulisiibacteriota bacterium]